MDLVIDANILFAALIKDSYIRKILSLSNHSFYIPKFILEEINKHKQEIVGKAEISEEKLKEVFDEIIENSNINVIPFEDFKEFISKAKEISYDPNDIEYFALALKLNCPIWSDDNDFKKQSQIKVFSTSELIKDFETS